jgi:hypothetical protein
MARSWHTLALTCQLLSAACGDDSETVENADASKKTNASAHSPPDSTCIKQCYIDATCDTVPADQQPNFEQTKREFAARCPDAGKFPFAVVGICSDGSKAVHLGTGKSSLRRYFAASGAFLSMETGVDYSKPPCDGRTYWPAEPACEGYTVTELLCGDSPWPVGHTF